MSDQVHKKHRAKSKKDTKVERQNPRAFGVVSGQSAARKAQYRAEVQERKLHVPLVDRSNIAVETPPVNIVVAGPPGVGKSTLIRSLVKKYTRMTLSEIKGPITVVSSKNRRLTFTECPNELNAMIDCAKVADLVLLLIDASFGFEMETFEFLNVLQTHGFPRIMGILTHLDGFTKNSQLRKVKKRMKHRFWTEIYDGAKLFYLSGLSKGKYPKQEILNLSRFISVMKFRPLIWHNAHPYMMVDRYEDVTDPEQIRTARKENRTITLYGYLHGTYLKRGTKIHIPGAGDFYMKNVTALPDPCPLPDAVKKTLSDKQKLIYAPMSDIGEVVYDQDATYIQLSNKKIAFTRQEGEDENMEVTPGVAMVRHLQDQDEVLDTKIRSSAVSLFPGGRPIAPSSSRLRELSDNEGSDEGEGEEDEEEEEEGDFDMLDEDQPLDEKPGSKYRAPRVSEVAETDGSGRVRRRAILDDADNEEISDADDDESDVSDDDEDDEDKPSTSAGKKGTPSKKDEKKSKKKPAYLDDESDGEEEQLEFDDSDEEESSSDEDDLPTHRRADNSGPLLHKPRVMNASDSENEEEEDGEEDEDSEEGSDDDDEDEEDGFSASEDDEPRKKVKIDTSHLPKPSGPLSLSAIGNAFAAFAAPAKKEKKEDKSDKKIKRVTQAFMESSEEENGDSDDSSSQQSSAGGSSEEEEKDTRSKKHRKRSARDRDEDDDKDLGVVRDHELVWKQQLTERALQRFRQPPNIMQIVYNEDNDDKEGDAASASLSGIRKALDDDDLFRPVKKKSTQESIDSAKFRHSIEALKDWENSELISDLKQRCIKPDDDIYGDFEDLEATGGESKGDKAASDDEDNTSDKKKSKKSKKGEAGDEENDEEAERMRKKLEKRKQFDSSYDNKTVDTTDTVVDGGVDAKPEENLQAKLNTTEFEGLDDETRASIEGFRPGCYVRIEITDIPYEFCENFDPKTPIIVGGLQAMEERMGFCYARVKKHRWHRKILKNNDPIVFSIGWRRFQSCPMYSTEDPNGRRRMLKYTPEHMHCLATFWGPLMPPNTGIIGFQVISNKQASFRVSLTGVILELDQSFKIVKKLKLIGHPYKIMKNTCFVKDMFNSALEATQFEGASLISVSGVRGQVKKALTAKGEAGHFRATFEDRVLLSDIIFLRTWHTVEPIKLYNPVTTLLDKEWRAMKTTYQMRVENQIPLVQNEDSKYTPIERQTRRFNSLKIPNSLMAALPYKSKPKLQQAKGKKKLDRVEKQLKVLEPREKKAATILQQLHTIKRDKLKKRKTKQKERIEKHLKAQAKEEASRKSTQKEKRKKTYAIKGAADERRKAKAE